MIRSICDRPEESSEKGYHSFDTSTLQLRSTFNTDAREQIRSVGALLLFLSIALNKDTFSNDTVSPPIHAFLPLALNRYMAVDRVDIPPPIHLGDPSQPRYRQHGESSFSRQGNGSREAGIHPLQSDRSHPLAAGTTAVETVSMLDSSHADGCSVPPAIRRRSPIDTTSSPFSCNRNCVSSKTRYDENCNVLLTSPC